jgi:DNA-binding XRE family transcriptional regulator
MKTNNKSELYSKFVLYCFTSQQHLIVLRKSKMSQEKIAKESGVSLKTIQRFENYEINSYLLFAYKEILK